MIEIGPGRGALTEKLLRRAARVVAIEIDAALVEHLRTRFAGEPRLEIVHADVLATDLARWGRAPIAGNLPYYITSPILEKAVRLDVPRVVFLIQKEVAERLIAQPRHREYGYLTLQTAMFADTRLLFEVKPGAFRPPPQVDSAVVLLTPAHARPGRGRPRSVPAFPQPVLPPEAEDPAQQSRRRLWQRDDRCLAGSGSARGADHAGAIRRDV